jgi:hypothetical protein
MEGRYIMARYHTPIWRELERERNLRKTTDSNVRSAKLATLAKEAELASKKYEAAVKAHSRFADGEEYAPGTIIKFKHTFKNSDYYSSVYKAYDYAALLAENGYWYLTCSNTNRMTWDELVEFIGDEEASIVLPNSKGWKQI